MAVPPRVLCRQDPHGTEEDTEGQRDEEGPRVAQQGLDPGHGAGRTLPTPPAPTWAPPRSPDTFWLGEPRSASFPLWSVSHQTLQPLAPGPGSPGTRPWVSGSQAPWPPSSTRSPRATGGGQLSARAFMCCNVHLPAGLSSAGTAARQPGLREVASSPGQRPLGVQAGGSRPLLPPPSKAWPSASLLPSSRSELDLVQINSKARGRLKPRLEGWHLPAASRHLEVWVIRPPDRGTRGRRGGQAAWASGLPGLRSAFHSAHQGGQGEGWS